VSGNVVFGVEGNYSQRSSRQKRLTYVACQLLELTVIHRLLVILLILTDIGHFSLHIPPPPLDISPWLPPPERKNLLFLTRTLAHTLILNPD